MSTLEKEAVWVDSAEVLTHLCFYWQSLWAACWLTEKAPLSSFHQTLGRWVLLRRRLWMSPPTLTCGETTQIISYVKYDIVQSRILQEHPVYCRSFYKVTSFCCWQMLNCHLLLLGGGPGACTHSHADDCERLPTLLPDDRPTSRWPEPGTDSKVCSTVHCTN